MRLLAADVNSVFRVIDDERHLLQCSRGLCLLATCPFCSCYCACSVEIERLGRGQKLAPRQRSCIPPNVRLALPKHSVLRERRCVWLRVVVEVVPELEAMPIPTAMEEQQPAEAGS